MSVGFQFLFHPVFTQNFLLCLLFSKASLPPPLFPLGGTHQPLAKAISPASAPIPCEHLQRPHSLALCWRHILAPLPHSAQCSSSQNKQNIGSTSRKKAHLPRQTENPAFCYKSSQSWFELNCRVKTGKAKKPTMQKRPKHKILFLSLGEMTFSQECKQNSTG